MKMINATTAVFCSNHRGWLSFVRLPSIIKTIDAVAAVFFWRGQRSTFDMLFSICIIKRRDINLCCPSGGILSLVYNNRTQTETSEYKQSADCRLYSWFTKRELGRYRYSYDDDVPFHWTRWMLLINFLIIPISLRSVSVVVAYCYLTALNCLTPLVIKLNESNLKFVSL